MEESGLDLPDTAFRALGTLQFPGFKPALTEDWLVFLAEVPPSLRGSDRRTEEGELHWIASDKLLDLNLWPGDRHFLPLVLAGRPFVGTMWYRDGRCVRHWL